MTLRLAESLYPFSGTNAGSNAGALLKGWRTFTFTGSASFPVGCHAGFGNNIALRMGFADIITWADGYYLGGGYNYFNSLGTTLIFGAHMQWLTSAVSTPSWIELADSAQAIHVRLAIASDGTINAYRGSGTSNLLGSSAAGVITGTTYFMFEFKIVIHGSTGSIVVKKDNITILNLTGLNTLGASGDIYNVSFIGASATNFFIQDIYICDNQGSTNNDFLGDIRIEGLMPNGAGNYTQFTPSTGSNWQNVNEIVVSNPFGTYNINNTAGSKDSYALDNLVSTSGTVLGVNVIANALKAETPPRGAKVFIRSASVDSSLSGELLMFNNFTSRVVRQIYELDPSGSAWTIASVNAAEAGFTISS